MATQVSAPFIRIGKTAELNWILPATAMTLALGLFVVVFAPPGASLGGTLAMFPVWLLAGAFVYFTGILVQTIRLMRDRNPAPLRALDLRVSPIVLGGFALAGLNMTLFMCVKPILNLLVPFTADPFLARLDALIFFGKQPANLFSFLNTDALAIFYHRGWFVLMIAALVHLLRRASSREKSALLTTYFALWTLVGPIVHLLVPAGGPIFYERLTGDHWTVTSADATAKVSETLWTYYSTGTFGPGAGISAMPSLHIATTAWVYLVFRRTRFAVPVALCGLLIFALSMSLGWHYFSDGVVGATLCWVILKALAADRSATWLKWQNLLRRHNFFQLRG